MTRRRTAILVIVVVGVVAIAIATSLRAGPPAVPVAEVTRGEFVDYLELQGEVRPVESTTLSAPMLAGDLEIVALAENGTQVRRGDLLAAFNPSMLERAAQDSRSTLREAEAEIAQTQAQSRIADEQDVTAVTKARYDVERAKLDTGKSEFLSRNEVEKARLGLADAEHRLTSAEEKLKADREIAAADVAMKLQKRDKAAADVQHAERGIAALQLRAPRDGLVSIMQNFRASNRFDDSSREYRVGDRSWPGMAIVEIPDLSVVRLLVRLEEAERGRVRQGQAATVRLESIPGHTLDGRVGEISVLARLDFSSWPASKNFDLFVDLLQTDPRLRPGMSGTVRIVTDRVADALIAPSDAIFQKDGRPVAYVVTGSRIEPRSVRIGRRNAANAIVLEGLKAGERVSLKDPSQQGAGQ